MKRRPQVTQSPLVAARLENTLVATSRMNISKGYDGEVMTNCTNVLPSRRLHFALKKTGIAIAAGFLFIPTSTNVSIRDEKKKIIKIILTSARRRSPPQQTWFADKITFLYNAILARVSMIRCYLKGFSHYRSAFRYLLDGSSTYRLTLLQLKLELLLPATCPVGK